MRGTQTLIASSNPDVCELIAKMALAAMETHTVSVWASAADIAGHALEAQAAVHELLNTLQEYGRYDSELADTAYNAATAAIRRFEIVLERLNDRFCESGKWIAGGLEAYQVVLSAAVMARGIRSNRLGLKDPTRRVPAFDYAE